MVSHPERIFVVEFSLFDFAKYDRQWWFAVCGIHIGNIYAAAMHVENDQGLWKVDVMGLRAMYFLLRNRDG